MGEHPTAADTLGVKVLGLRYRNVLLAGVVAGIGGASYTLALYAFTKNMIGGKGFIALAALIFGRWSPTGALLAALFFGFADQLATYLGAIGSTDPEPVPGHAAVPGDHPGGGRAGRPGPGTGRRRQAVHQGLSRPVGRDACSRSTGARG